MFGLRPLEILLIVAAIVLLFGATRLPQLARSIGQTRKAFKEGLHDPEDDDKPVEPKKISPNAISSLSDEEILAEMQRRAEVKTKAS